MANKYTATPIPPDLESLYRSGMSQAELAQYFSVTQKIVWKWMRRAGIQSRIAAKRDQRGEKNSTWRGDKATYQAFHIRVAKLRGNEKHCEDCGIIDQSKSYDWANLTGNYADANDYKRLCRSCHSKMDKKINNIRKGAMPC